MFRIIQSVRVGEVGICKTDPRGGFVHQIRKGFNVARYLDGDGGSRIVGAFQHQGT